MDNCHLFQWKRFCWKVPSLFQFLCWKEMKKMRTGRSFEIREIQLFLFIVFSRGIDGRDVSGCCFDS